MRLIDAEKFEFMSFRPQGGREYAQAFDDGAETVARKIYDAPTVAAIPVEWLRNLCAIAKMETDDEMFIDWLIQTWQQEQEENGE